MPRPCFWLACSLSGAHLRRGALGYMLNQVHTLGDVTTYVLQKKYLLTYVKFGHSADEVLTYLCENSAASRPKYLLTYLCSSPHIVLIKQYVLQNKYLLTYVNCKIRPLRGRSTYLLMQKFGRFAAEVLTYLLTYLCGSYLP